MAPFPIALVKVIGTLGVCGLIWWSVQNPDKGMLREVTAFGPVVAWWVAGIFLACVFAYARDLQRLLRAVPEPLRAARPG